MATTSSFPHINKAISLFTFTPEIVQGTANYSFTSDGTGSTTTTIVIDTTSGATHNNNIANITANFFQGLQVYFAAGTATAALQSKVYNISASTAVSGTDVTLTVDTMAGTPGATDTFFVLGALPADSVSISPETEDLPRDFHKLTLDSPAGIKGLSKVSGSFNTELPGLVTTLGNGATATLDRFSVMLSQIASRRASAGSLVVSSTTTTITVSVGEGANFAEDDMIMVAVSGTNYVRRVTGVSTDTITLDRALSAGPAAAAVVYNSESYTPADTDHGTLSFLFLEDDRLYVVLGALCNIKIGSAFTEMTKATIEFDGEWDGSSQISDAAALSGYQADIDPIPFITTAGFYFNDTDVSVNSAEFDLGHSRAEIRDTEAGNRFFTRERAATIQAVFRDQDKTPKATWEKSGTKARMVAMFGDSAGACVGVEGIAQIADPISMSDVNGTGYWDATWRFFDDQDAASATKPRIIRF